MQRLRSEELAGRQGKEAVGIVVALHCLRCVPTEENCWFLRLQFEQSLIDAFRGFMSDEERRIQEADGKVQMRQIEAKVSL